MDDIIIATKTFKEHLRVLELVLQCIMSAGLTINRQKSQFRRSDVKFLWFVVKPDGFYPDPEKITLILEYPVPKNLKQLKCFIGMASWYQKFSNDFATVAEALTHLTKWNLNEVRRSIWTFEYITALIASTPVFHGPSFEHEFVIQTYAGDTGIAEVLTQTLNGITVGDKAFFLSKYYILRWRVDRRMNLGRG